MKLSVQSLTQVEVFPYYADVPLEVAPCLTSGEAEYIRGTLNDMAYEGLKILSSAPQAHFLTGATYVALGRDERGAQIQTHWMYCTQTTPVPTLAVARNHSTPGVFAPAPHIDQSLLLSLEPLEEIIGVSSYLPSNLDAVEFRLGLSGDLISTAFGAPHAMGIRVNDPFLPPHFLTGARHLTITARSSRTKQSIGLHQLVCVQASDPAVFLSEAHP
ncbi:hypothetical protein V8J82_19980 [Gymnodinialimonas sp. 2305UL16-5]|uniref:hypothetical protein n=1 Tax=Gymnodinialimonas mytili TaxID=3126503 RepID=UPI003095BEBC